MPFRYKLIAIPIASTMIGILAFSCAAYAQQPDESSQTQAPGSQPGNQAGRPGRDRGQGPGGFMGGARGLLGTVTEVTPEHYSIKIETGETYAVHYSANTRIFKQAPGRKLAAQGSGGDNSGADRQPPVPLKPTDIKVGDIITAGGEVDSSARSVGAMVIVQVDPERAKQMRAMQANYGKTWISGRITAIDGTRITIEGTLDHASHAIDLDENTSIRKRRDSVTLADLKPDDMLRAEGAPKADAFLATTVTVMGGANGARPDGPPGAKQPN